MTDAQSYKLLYIAFCCEPGRGSEWGLGWSYVEEMSRTQPVWVIVHDDCRPALNRYLSEKHKYHPVHVTYVTLPKPIEWMRNSFYSLFNIYYYLWQFWAGRAARKLHRQVGFDLVQHVSLFRWWMPSAGAALVKDGVGFIFGPVGGGEVLPKKFRDQSPFYGKFGDALRYIGRSILRHDPILKRCINRAHLLLAGIPAAEEWFRKYDNPKIELICSATSSSEDVCREAREARAARDTNAPFTFASCGGLSYYRGVDITIRAFAKAKLPNAQYVHVCDGALRQSCEDLASELGVTDRVRLVGDIGHLEGVKTVARADACVHMVLRDSQGILCEIMQAGVPVITLDHLTPAMLVTPECGHLIPVNDETSPDELVEALAKVMRQWYDDRGLVAAKGRAAAERGKSFSPAAKGALYREQHQRVLRQIRSVKASSAAREHNPPARVVA